jgi:hypothetical protein
LSFVFGLVFFFNSFLVSALYKSQSLYFEYDRILKVTSGQKQNRKKIGIPKESAKRQN